jgi:hypothetical protein
MNMGYVIAAILVMLIVGGFVLFLVINSTRKSNLSDAQDPGADQNPMAIVGSDRETPLGDTPEHADADSGDVRAKPYDRPEVARPVVGGEAEARRST